MLDFFFLFRSSFVSVETHHIPRFLFFFFAMLWKQEKQEQEKKVNNSKKHLYPEILSFPRTRPV